MHYVRFAGEAQPWHEARSIAVAQALEENFVRIRREFVKARKTGKLKSLLVWHGSLVVACIARSTALVCALHLRLAHFCVCVRGGGSVDG